MFLLQQLESLHLQNLLEVLSLENPWVHSRKYQFQSSRKMAIKIWMVILIAVRKLISPWLSWSFLERANPSEGPLGHVISIYSPIYWFFFFFWSAISHCSTQVEMWRGNQQFLGNTSPCSPNHLAGRFLHVGLPEICNPERGEVKQQLQTCW